MAEDKDIIAAAPADGPEVLDEAALDAAAGGAEYGGTNTCEPVRHRTPSHMQWSPIVSMSEDADAPGGLKSK